MSKATKLIAQHQLKQNKTKHAKCMHFSQINLLKEIPKRDRICNLKLTNDVNLELVRN